MATVSKYILQEKFGISKYEIQIISNGYNEDIIHWSRECRTSELGRIERFQWLGKMQKKFMIERDSRKFKEIV